MLAALGLAASWTTRRDDRRDDAAAAPGPRRSRSSTPRSSRWRACRAAADYAGRARPQLAPARLLRPLESHAVLLLALIAIALGASSVAYNVLDDARGTAVGVLLTFVLLVQFGGFLDRRQRADAARPAGRHVAAPRAHVRAAARSSRCSSTSSSSAARSSPRTCSSSAARAASFSAASSSRRCRWCSGALPRLRRVPHLPVCLALRDGARRAARSPGRAALGGRRGRRHGR